MPEAVHRSYRDRIIEKFCCHFLFISSITLDTYNTKSFQKVTEAEAFIQEIFAEKSVVVFHDLLKMGVQGKQYYLLYFKIKR